jgi:hypothetical protein
MKMPLHVGQRHAPERRPCDCIKVPSLGQSHAVSVLSVIVHPSSRLRGPLRRYARAGLSGGSDEWWSVPAGLSYASSVGSPDGNLRLAAFPYIAGIVLHDALQLFGRQPAPEASPRVVLGSGDERLTEALVQAGALFISRFHDVPLWVTYDDKVVAVSRAPARTAGLALGLWGSPRSRCP